MNKYSIVTLCFGGETKWKTGVQNVERDSVDSESSSLSLDSILSFTSFISNFKAFDLALMLY